MNDTDTGDALAATVANCLDGCPVGFAAAPVAIGRSAGEAIRAFSAAGMPIFTILLKALPIVLADLAAGKPLGQIIKDVIAAFVGGSL